MLRGRSDSDEANHPPLQSDEPLPPVPVDDRIEHERSPFQAAQSTLQRLMAVDLNPCEKYIKYIVMGFNAVVLLFAFILIGVGSAALNGNYNSLTSSQISSGLIVLGVFFLLLGLLGLLAAWREHRPTLGVYFILLLLLCFITLIVGIAVYVKKDSADYYITNAWMNIFNDDPTSGTLRDLSMIYDCCGLNTARDHYTPVTSIIYNINSSLACDPRNGTYGACMYKCPQLPDNGWNEPCGPIIEQSFYDNFYTAGACGIAFAILMAVMSIFIVLLFRGIGVKRQASSTAKAVVDPMNTDEHETDTKI